MSASENDRLADLFHMDEATMTAVNASMPPDMCSPAALYLAHETCELNGEVIQVGMGGAARLAVVHAQGLMKDPITPEDIAENIGTDPRRDRRPRHRRGQHGDVRWDVEPERRS